jgi:hypothetical protein
MSKNEKSGMKETFKRFAKVAAVVGAVAVGAAVIA